MVSPFTDAKATLFPSFPVKVMSPWTDKNKEMIGTKTSLFSRTDANP